MSLGDHDHRGNISAQIDYSNFSSKWRLKAQYYVHNVPVGGSHKLDVVVTDSVALEVGDFLFFYFNFNFYSDFILFEVWAYIKPSTIFFNDCCWNSDEDEDDCDDGDDDDEGDGDEDDDEDDVDDNDHYTTDNDCDN